MTLQIHSVDACNPSALPRIPNLSNPMPKGLVLMTGPTGAGKNSVYALMNTLNPEDAQVVYEAYQRTLNGE